MSGRGETTNGAVGFESFVSARSSARFGVAVAIAGDRDQAERLLVNALARTRARWSRIRNDPEPYVRRAMVDLWGRSPSRRSHAESVVGRAVGSRAAESVSAPPGLLASVRTASADRRRRGTIAAVSVVGVALVGALWALPLAAPGGQQGSPRAGGGTVPSSKVSSSSSSAGAESSGVASASPAPTYATGLLPMFTNGMELQARSRVDVTALRQMALYFYAVDEQGAIGLICDTSAPIAVTISGSGASDGLMPCTGDPQLLPYRGQEPQAPPVRLVIHDVDPTSQLPLDHVLSTTSGQVEAGYSAHVAFQKYPLPEPPPMLAALSEPFAGSTPPLAAIDARGIREVAVNAGSVSQQILAMPSRLQLDLATVATGQL